MVERRRYKHLIVGTGFGGLCLAAKLKQSGEDDFLLVEKAQSVGGTWRENTYPGAECDIPSSFYSFSFWPNPKWKRKWSDQKQIIDYIHRFTVAQAIDSHIEFGHRVIKADYNDDEKTWMVETSQGILNCRFLTFAVGQLHHPRFPETQGVERFQGQTFHSAEWPAQLDCQGKSVAVIGNAASAVQLVPKVAEQASNVTVYQRSPNWCVPKPNREYTRAEHWLADKVPPIAKLYRMGIWALGEFVIYPIIRGRWPFTALGEWYCKRQINQLIDDPSLREKLVPSYPIGAKRILFTTDYYEALNKDHVELVDSPMQSIDESGINVGDKLAHNSTHRKHDILIYATGFHTNPFLRDIEVRGSQGKLLAEQWQGGATAYLGVQTSGYPNMFMLYGPNTNTGHSSIIFKLEAQVELILRLLERAKASGENTAVEVDAKAEATFNQEIQRRLADTAWDKVEESWYKDAGRVTNNWPGSSREFRSRSLNPNFDHFIFHE